MVFGNDAGSGVVTGPIAPTVARSPVPTKPSSVAQATWTADDDDEDATRDGDDHGAELRKYTIVDLAGNTTVLKVKVKLPVVRARTTSRRG